MGLLKLLRLNLLLDHQLVYRVHQQGSPLDLLLILLQDRPALDLRVVNHLTVHLPVLHLPVLRHLVLRHLVLHLLVLRHLVLRHLLDHFLEDFLILMRNQKGPIE